MEIILRETIEKLGKTGEIVNVREGYGRNFLLPRGKAVLADKQNVKELEHHKRAVLARQAKLKKEAEAFASRVSSLTINLSREAGEGDKLFGAVTNKDIADALRKEGIIIEKKQIVMEAPFKSLGQFDVSVKLHPEVVATFKLAIVKA